MTEQHTPYKLPLENDLIPRKAIYDKNKAFVAECDSIEIAESLIRAANHIKEAVDILDDITTPIYLGDVNRQFRAGFNYAMKLICERIDKFLHRIEEAQDE